MKKTGSLWYSLSLTCDIPYHIFTAVCACLYAYLVFYKNLFVCGLILQSLIFFSSLSSEIIIHNIIYGSLSHLQQGN